MMCLSCGNQIIQGSPGPSVCKGCWDQMSVAERLAYKTALWQHQELKDFHQSVDHLRVQVEMFRVFIEKTVEDARHNQDCGRFPWENQN